MSTGQNIVRRCTPHGMACRSLVVAALAMGLLAPAIAGAAGTDPTLALTSADASAAAGNTMVRLRGSMQFEDLLQFSFPAGVILFRGTSFLHIPVNGVPVSGEAAFLADGLAASELFSLLGIGVPAAAPAALLTLQPNEMRIALPADFGAGAATAVVYAVLEGDPFLSNPIAVTLP